MHCAAAVHCWRSAAQPPVRVINFPVCVYYIYYVFLRTKAAYKIISKITTTIYDMFQRCKYWTHRQLSFSHSPG